MEQVLEAKVGQEYFNYLRYGLAHFFPTWARRPEAATELTAQLERAAATTLQRGMILPLPSSDHNRTPAAWMTLLVYQFHPRSQSCSWWGSFQTSVLARAEVPLGLAVSR
jgi:hypothetical protein